GATVAVIGLRRKTVKRKPA
ncbi:unnamed protein product, partial [Adineta steineri]